MEKVVTKDFFRRKQILQDFDVADFSCVPQYIINSFFEKTSYKNRLIITMFAYLNGISLHRLFDIVKKTSPTVVCKRDRLQQIEKLWKHIEQYWKRENGKWIYTNSRYANYFSYSTMTNEFITVDGRISSTQKTHSI